ncbi:MAG: TolC family protein, partial [Ferruginibacter sp.]|nr:TolC family protein [Cytophagales bacterium]
ADGKWSLQECVDYALVYNIAIKQTQLTVLSSQAAINQSYAGLLPSVNGSASYSISTGRSLNTFTNTYQDNSVRSSPLSLNANLNLFSGFQQINLIRQNLLARQANQLSVEQQKNLTALDVALNYVQVLQGQELVEVSRFQVASTQGQVDRTEKLVNAGALPQTSLFDLKAQLANDQVALVTAQNNMQLYRLALMQTMNLPANQNFDVEKIVVDDPATQEYELSSQALYDLAVESQPNIRGADKLVESSRRGVLVAKGGLYPSLSLGGFYGGSYANIVNDFLPDGQTATVVAPLTVGPNSSVFVENGGQRSPVFVSQTTNTGRERVTPYLDQLRRTERKVIQLSLNIPIFNGFQTRYRIATAVIQQKSNELAAQNARIQLRQTIEQAYTNMRLAAQQFLAYTQQVEALSVSFKAAESRFNTGALNSFDFALQKNNLNRAQANLVQSKYNYVFRTKVLDFYQNKPLTF